ncbi:DUF3307 domain-containing protein [Umezawaea beigongshangensis]|uniref:DUF3307 domain-containing protein n=1 Tax=Umezawaea beigongshangensis TaxID=2780383 RepID=UPI0018F21BA6|nr:DUF3307 domain-containing protein [Umezawaea beigongshangensis]
MSLTAAVTFAVVLPGLLVAHAVADHWGQTSHQAATKGRPGRAGRVACASHVAVYTAVTAAVVALLWAVLDLTISPAGFFTGQVVSAVTHYWADRYTTLAKLAALVGKAEFYALGAPREVIALTDTDVKVRLFHTDAGGAEVSWDNPSLGTGAYALDQSWHWLWLLVAALLTAVVA